MLIVYKEPNGRKMFTVCRYQTFSARPGGACFSHKGLYFGRTKSVLFIGLLTWYLNSLPSSKCLRGRTQIYLTHCGRVTQICAF